jgi:beta-glucosidase
VPIVCTVNEPNIAAMLAGGEQLANLVAFGLAAPDLQVADVLLDAHHAAQERLASLPGVASGWTIATQAVEASGEPGSDEAARAYSYPREDWYLEAARGDDFVGVQAYTRTIVGPDGPHQVRTDVETTQTGWEFFPPALERGVRAAWQHAGVPVIVTENGIATDDDERRIDYTAGALAGLHDAIADGVDVRGYFHWSALDNYEWASGYGPKFGLIRIDRETFARHPKPSLAWLGAVAEGNSLPTTRQSAAHARRVRG